MPMLGYARVSTDDQDLTGQRLRLEAAGAVRIFEDVASGKAVLRPGLSLLLDYAREGDTIAVVRLDRLGRSLRELLATVEDLKARGINFLSLEEQLDTASAAGELVFHIFGSIAHFERRLISERTHDGLAAARARGKVLGRPALPVETLQAARDLVAAGRSVTATAKHLGVGRSTLYRELQE